MSVRVRFPPEAQEGRLPPSLLCYCPSPQPLSLAERGGAHALSAPADRAFAVPSRLFIHPQSLRDSPGGVLGTVFPDPLRRFALRVLDHPRPALFELKKRSLFLPLFSLIVQL